MPNHVDHKLTIVGAPETVRAFVDKAHAPPPRPGDPPGTINYREGELEAEHLSFHAIVPLPASYREKPYADHGYDLEHKTWGVKWGAYNQEAPPVLVNDRATYTFTCAWGCPDKWLEAASKSWPTLRFFVSFGGEGPTAGRCMYVDGIALIDEHPAYDEADYPNLPDDADEATEAAWSIAYDAAEHRFIALHDAWVDVQLAATLEPC